jgi:hypothetical protein
MDLTPTQLRLAGDLLEQASDVFSNHGCNDCPWPDYMNREQRLHMATQMVADNNRKAVEDLTDEEREEAKGHAESKCMPDWWFMSFLAKRLGHKS